MKILYLVRFVKTPPTSIPQKPPRDAPIDEAATAITLNFDAEVWGSVVKIPSYDKSQLSQSVNCVKAYRSKGYRGAANALKATQSGKAQEICQREISMKYLFTKM
jgi:hypothetical protein